jgi:uncharacterized phage protein (TIGR02218 family)
MSFTPAENAVVSEPIELLLFARDEEYWAYAIHDADVTRNGVLYRAAVITRSPFEASDELNLYSTKVQISTDTPLGALLQQNGLSGVRGDFYMRLMLTHANDTETWSPFFGVASEIVAHGTYVELTVDSVQKWMKRNLLRVSGGVQCSHVLYDSGCGVNMDDFVITVTVAASAGRNTQVGATAGNDPDNTLQTIDYYAGGMLVYGTERYFIEHNDNAGNLRMGDVVPSYIVGQTDVKLYAGCDRSYRTCKDRFDNVRNFGGFPHFPVVNPFEGTR